MSLSVCYCRVKGARKKVSDNKGAQKFVCGGCSLVCAMAANLTLGARDLQVAAVDAAVVAVVSATVTTATTSRRRTDIHTER